MRFGLVFIWCFLIGLNCTQAQDLPPPVSYNETGPTIYFEDSFKNPVLKNRIRSFIEYKYIASFATRKEKSTISLGFDGTYYTIKQLPDNTVIFKIANEGVAKTFKTIKQNLLIYIHGFKVKNLDLKNRGYIFDFKLVPVENSNGVVGQAIPENQLSRTDGVLNLNTFDDTAVLEVTNLSNSPIYFSVIEINSQGMLNGFVPNINCPLLGAQRRLEPNETKVFETCVFKFAPPYETLTLKGFASPEPINFNPIINNEDNASLDYVQDFYTEMFTTEFQYNIVDTDGNTRFVPNIDSYEPNTSTELENALSDLEILEITEGQYNASYIDKLTTIASIHKKLENFDEAKEYEKLVKEYADALASDTEETEEVVTETEKPGNADDDSNKDWSTFSDLDKIKELEKSNAEKDTLITILKAEIDTLKKEIETLKKNIDTSTTYRGSNPITLEKNPLSEYTYRALIIAEEDYEDHNIKDLKFPISDAKKLQNILETKYAFESSNINFLENPTRSEIFRALDELFKISSKTDHLLIFFAGHGVYDESFKRGYWLPSDAAHDVRSNWISNPDIKDYITNINTTHTLLISDACFSGSIFEFNRNVDLGETSPVVKKLLQKNARNAMTSGLDKPVPDESVFIKYLLKALEENTTPYIKASDLFNTIQEAVLANTENIPQFGVIKNANHEGGEFIFLKSE